MDSGDRFLYSWVSPTLLNRAPSLVHTMPHFVTRHTFSRSTSFKALPTITSLFPKLYPGAVSIRLIPRSTAFTIVSIQSRSSRSPFHAGPPPIAQDPFWKSVCLIFLTPYISFFSPIFLNFYMLYLILQLCCRPARRACVTGCPLGILYSAVCDTLPAAHPPAPCSSHLLSLQYSGH